MSTSEPVNQDLSQNVSAADEALFNSRIIATALACTDTMVSIMKMDTTIVYANEPHERITGYEPGELAGKKGFDLIHPDDKKRLLPLLTQYTTKFIGTTIKNFLTNKKSPFTETFEYRVRHKSGNWLLFESLGAIIDGKIFNFSKDITDKKQTEINLAEKNKYNSIRAEVWKIASDKSLTEEELIQKLLDIIGPAIGVSRACYNKFLKEDPYKSDLICILEWCDDNTGPSLGTKLPTYLVKHFIQEEFFILTPETAFNILPVQFRRIAEAFVSTLIKTLKLESVLVVPHLINNKIKGLFSFDVCIKNKNKPVWTDEIKIIIREIVTIVSNHIAQKQAEAELEKHRHNLEELVAQRTEELTQAYKQLQKEIEERKLTEDALRIAEKMETVGLLAGGVAHDLNNILSGLVSCPDMLLLEMPVDSPLRELAQAIKDSGLKAAAVVQDLLSLSQGSLGTMGVVNLNTIVSDLINSLEYKNLTQSLPEINFDVSLDNKVQNISASPVHISKSIMNLVLNAADAILNKGTLSVITRNKSLKDDTACYGNSINKGNYAVLSVIDTGRGIASDDLERIFEPFYTKKIMHRKGTGLGLAIVWRTMQDHNGYIDVHSAQEGGTTFDLYFPVTTEIIPQMNIPLSIDDYKGNGETILVIDDIAEQRSIAEKMLLKLGYTVSVASSGEEAIDYLKYTAVDLIILDMIMVPGIDGLETYKRILEIHPTQRALITSGFSETERVRKALTLGAGKYIKKPYTIEILGTAIKEELLTHHS